MSFRFPRPSKASWQLVRSRAWATGSLVWKYVAALVIASFLSLFYFGKYEYADADTPSGTTVFNAIGTMLSGVANGGEAATRALGILVTGNPNGLRKEIPPHTEKTKKPQTMQQLLLKIVVVISISFLWFQTFVTANNIKNTWEHSSRLRSHPCDMKAIRLLLIVAAIFPALAFVLSMSGAYEPAVFVMALVAIFMAAEHYGGLRESKDELDKKANDIIDKIGLVLNADGLADWRSRIYVRYNKAKRRIDAVIHYFDIDAIWWRCAGSGTARAAWQDYEKMCTGTQNTLLGALAGCEANIQFVCDFPMPYRGLQSPSRQKRAAYFRNFVGLAFNLVVFERIRLERDEKKKGQQNTETLASRFFPYARIIISHAPSWMHVIDDVAYQVLERGSAEEATVRRLDLNETDPPARAAMNEWARRNVRQFAHRGSRAEEHVYAVLRYHAIRNPDMGDTKPLNENVLTSILEALGMDDFLALPNGEFRIIQPDEKATPEQQRSPLFLSKTDVQKACVCIFTLLLEQRMHAEVLGVPAPTIEMPTVQELIYEVM